MGSTSGRFATRTGKLSGPPRGWLGSTPSKVLFLLISSLQQACGGDVMVSFSAFPLRSRLLWTALGPRILGQPRLSGGLAEELHHLRLVPLLEDLPFRGRQRDHHPFVGRLHLLNQVVVRHRLLYRLPAVLRAQRRTHH